PLLDTQPQANRAVTRMRTIAAHQPGQQHADRRRHQQGMAESAVIGHVGHGIAVVKKHIQIRQGAQCGAVQQRLAPLPAAQQRPLNGGAEYRLGYGIHQRLWCLSSSIAQSSSSSRPLRALSLVLRWAVMFSWVSWLAIAI